MYDESKKLTNIDFLNKKPKDSELKTKYTKEFIEKNMKKDYDGLGEVRFKGKNKWGQEGYDPEDPENSDRDETEKETKELKKLSKKKQQRLQEKSKKLLRTKKRKKKKQKEANEIEGFGDQGDLLELAGKSGGWGGQGFTDQKEDQTDSNVSNAKNPISIPKSKKKKRKKPKKDSKSKKQKKNKKKSRNKQKAHALFGAEGTNQVSHEPISEPVSKPEDKFSDLDLLQTIDLKPASKKTSSSLVSPLNIDIEEYQEKWEALDEKQEEFKLTIDGSMKKFKKTLKSVGFAILDVQDTEIICAATYKTSEVLLYISVDSDESDGIIASNNSQIASLVISALS